MSSSAPKLKRPEPGAGPRAGDPVYAAALRAVQARRGAVLATIVGVQGSSPREVGARMLVGTEAIDGTVGGGVLEHMVIQRARTLLGRRASRCLLSFPLGPDSQQCCGGVVTLLLEPLAAADRSWLKPLAGAVLARGVGLVTPLGAPAPKSLIAPATSPGDLADEPREWFRQATVSDACLIGRDENQVLCQYLVQPDFEVALFGAGHVGRALAAALAVHRCRLLWVDPREAEFPRALPANARALITGEVGEALAEVSPGALVLVMTHRHPLDYAICRAVLERGDQGFLGLIGSRTKRRRFAKALQRDGLAPDVIDKLCCPIGIPGLKGKEPEVIAASVVAQLLLLAQEQREHERASGIHQRDAEASAIAASF